MAPLFKSLLATLAVGAFATSIDYEETVRGLWDASDDDGDGDSLAPSTATPAHTRCCNLTAPASLPRVGPWQASSVTANSLMLVQSWVSLKASSPRTVAAIGSSSMNSTQMALVA